MIQKSGKALLFFYARIFYHTKQRTSIAFPSKWQLTWRRPLARPMRAPLPSSAFGYTGRPGLSCNFIAIFLIYGDYIITSRYSTAPGENMRSARLNYLHIICILHAEPIKLLNWILRGIVSAQSLQVREGHKKRRKYVKTLICSEKKSENQKKCAKDSF